MTSELSTPEKRYRPAMRGLAFGLLALGLRAATVGIVLLAASTHPAHKNLEAAYQMLPIQNLLAASVALIGVGYSAIASHRREWGAVLVLAWIFSVAAALFDIQPFVYLL